MISMPDHRKILRRSTSTLLSANYEWSLLRHYNT